MAGYEPRFDIDFQRGLVGENLVGTFLQGLAGSRIEVKTDYQAWRTGNLYVETHQHLRGQWVKSGINLSQSEYYCFAGPTGCGFITIETRELIRLAIESPRIEGGQTDIRTTVLRTSENPTNSLH
jgi:hypothetical protein